MRKKERKTFFIKWVFFNINVSDKISQSCSYASSSVMENSRLRSSAKRELLDRLILESDAYITFERLNFYLLLALAG